MNIKKIINSALTIMGLALVAAGAQAQTQFVSVTGGNATFIYTSGTSGGLTLTATNFYTSLDVPKAGVLVNNPAIVSFSGLKNSGTTSTVLFKGNTLFSQDLTGGAFTINDGLTNQLLLAGTYSGANLSGTIGTQQAGVDTNFMNVAYTGGLYATLAGIQLNGTPLDKFNFSLIPVNPALATTTTGGVMTLSGFTSAGNGQFTGTSTVPEPASVIPFALGGLGLLGLIARKTRRSSGAAA